MPDNKYSGVEANIINLGHRMDKVIEYLEKVNDKQTVILMDMAVIKSVQGTSSNDFKEYKEECTTDREEQKKTINEIRAYQTAQKTWVAGIALIITSVFNGAWEWLKH